MKTTVEIPDPLFRQAKATAAQRGISLKDFFTEAVKAQLRSKAGRATPDKPWRKAFGGLRDIHRENQRVDRLISEEFERIEPEAWR